MCLYLSCINFHDDSPTRRTARALMRRAWCRERFVSCLFRIGREGLSLVYRLAALVERKLSARAAFARCLTLRELGAVDPTFYFCGSAGEETRLSSVSFVIGRHPFALARKRAHSLCDWEGCRGSLWARGR